MATIKIKQIKSKIGYPVDQKRTLEALGLHKISVFTRSLRLLRRRTILLSAV